MSFWKPQKSYPTDAIHAVTIKATAGQRERWAVAANAGTGAAAGAPSSPTAQTSTATSWKRSARPARATTAPCIRRTGGNSTVTMKTASFTIHATALQSAR